MSKQQWKNKWEFKAEVCRVAQELKLDKVGRIYVRQMTRKWASVTTDGRTMTFNEELLSLDRELGRYVIVHELAHLRAANHGKLFKAIVRLHIPDFEKVDERLKKLSTSC